MSARNLGPPVSVLGEADAAAAIGLWEQAGLTRPWNDAAADYARAVACASSAMLGLQEDDRLVGTVMVGDDGHRGWLYYLAVAPDRRGQGLGRALVAAAEAWLAERGCPKVQLMIRSDNRAAADFYAAIGYEPQAVTVVGRRLDQRATA